MDTKPLWYPPLGDLWVYSAVWGLLLGTIFSKQVSHQHLGVSAPAPYEYPSIIRLELLAMSSSLSACLACH